MIAESTPMTSPLKLNSGPPELPWLMAASVWMKSSYGVSLMLRCSALTMPRLTEVPMPSGLPIANTESPICTLLLSAQVTAGSGLPASTLSSARSISRAAFRTCASRRPPSAKVTKIS